MKAILYTRVSTTKQVTDGVSLENQEKRLYQYADLHNYSDLNLITDEGVSGKHSNRVGFNQVMQSVKQNKCNAVIVYSLSRFARNTIDTLKYIEIMNKKDIAFHSLTEQIDTTTPIGRFFLTTLAGLAQLEREQIAERTKSALQHKKSKGERVGQIPFGKKLAKDGKSLVDNEQEMKIVILVKRLRKQGKSYNKIADELIKQRMKNRSGNVKWNTTQIYRLVTNTSPKLTS
jgi:DNA invertase Pin-like site-specific DNA recombinase